MAGLLLLNVPPGVPLLSNIELPMQTVDGPVRGAGVVLTVTVMPVEQPVGIVYLIIAMPGVTPVTTPVLKPTVAMAGVLLLQVPPGIASLTVIAVPMHKTEGPTIGAGSGLTLTTVVVEQPVPSE